MPPRCPAAAGPPPGCHARAISCWAIRSVMLTLRRCSATPPTVRIISTFSNGASLSAPCPRSDRLVDARVQARTCQIQSHDASCICAHRSTGLAVRLRWVKAAREAGKAARSVRQGVARHRHQHHRRTMQHRRARADCGAATVAQYLTAEQPLWHSTCGVPPAAAGRRTLGDDPWWAPCRARLWPGLRRHRRAQHRPCSSLAHGCGRWSPDGHRWGPPYYLTWPTDLPVHARPSGSARLLAAPSSARLTATSTSNAAPPTLSRLKSSTAVSRRPPKRLRLASTPPNASRRIRSAPLADASRV